MMMASSSANVKAPPTAGVQLTEGPLAAEVPADVHPGALSSRAGVGDTNAASASVYMVTQCESNSMSVGMTASAPYTRKKGVKPVDLFGVVRKL